MDITVLYSCRDCDLERVPCMVPARGEEPVLAWMDATIRVLAGDHARRSPACTARKLSDVMIPMTGADRIGGPAVQ